MKLLYILTLLVGCDLAILCQFVDFAVPRDAFVAGVLSRSPDSWTLSLDDAMKGRLSGHDVKAEVGLALEKRHFFRKDASLENFREGCGVILFSIIGLIRERKVDRLCRLIRQAPGPNTGSAAAPSASAS